MSIDNEQTPQKAITLKKHVIASLEIHLVDLWEAVLSWSNGHMFEPHETYAQARKETHEDVKRMLAMQKVSLHGLQNRIPVVLHSREDMEMAIRENAELVAALKYHLENAKLRYKFDHRRDNEFAEKAVREYAMAQCALDGEQESLRVLRAALAKLVPETPPPAFPAPPAPTFHNKTADVDDSSSSSDYSPSTPPIINGVSTDDPQSAHEGDTRSDPSISVSPESGGANHIDPVSKRPAAIIETLRCSETAAKAPRSEAALETTARTKRPRDDDEVEVDSLPPAKVLVNHVATKGERREAPANTESNEVTIMTGAEMTIKSEPMDVVKIEPDPKAKEFEEEFKVEFKTEQGEVVESDAKEEKPTINAREEVIKVEGEV